MADFPQGRLPIRVEMAFGADPDSDPADWTWADVSDDVHQQQIQITRGRADESGQAQPTSMSLELDNPHGNYTPDNPLSVHYPNVLLGTPCRASVEAGRPYLALPGGPDRASTPDHASLDITGDIDVRIEVALDDWSSSDVELASKYKTTGNQRSWLLLYGQVDRDLTFRWSSDGAGNLQFSSTEPVPAPTSGRIALRSTLDVSAGVITHYTAPTLDGPWTQLGAPSTPAGATSIYSSTTPVEIGDASSLVFNSPSGKVYRFELRDGIDGTIVAAPDFTAQTSGTTSFDDSAGRTWTLAGDAEITRWQRRFFGTVDEWAPTWPYGDLSDKDTGYEGEARVAITASGILRRLGQGPQALQSALRRELENPTRTGIVAYWPCEDDSGATQIASAIAGHPPMSVSGEPDLSSFSGWLGSDDLPVMKTGTFSGDVPTYTVTGETALRSYVHIPSGGVSSDQVLVELLTTGTARRWTITLKTDGDLAVGAFDGEGTSVLTFTVNFNANDSLRSIVLELTQSGNDVDWRIIAENYDGVADINTLVPGPVWSDTLAGHTVGRIVQVRIGPGGSLEDVSVGHIVLANALAAFSNTLRAAIGWTGERSGHRILRLCAEEGIPATLAGTDGATERIGSQESETLLALLQKAADVDGGILGEQRAQSGLRYRTRESLYNQTPALVVDAGENELTNPFEPILDDQRARNDVTVTREGGSSARVVDDTSVARLGLRPEEIRLNAATDEQLRGLAAWRVHLGTWPGMRYPTVSAELAIAPQLIESWLDVDSGSRVQVVNLPPQHPTDTVDLLLQGYAEVLSPTRWTVRANCTPAGPYTVAVVDDDSFVLDTAGPVLASAVTASDTTMYVATTAGPRWVDSATYPADFPIDLRVGGEVVRATAVGAPGAVPMVGDGDASTTAATDHVAPSVSAPGGADLLVCAWIPWDGPSDVYTIPGSMSEQAQTAGTWSRFADATEVLSGSGATGTRTATRTVSHAWAAVSIVASGAPGTTPVLEEHLDGVDGASGQVTLTSAAGTQEGWWLLALHGWDNSGSGLPPGPDGEGWQLVASSSLVHADAPGIVAYARRVETAGAQQVDFPGGAPDDNQARLYVLSGVTDLTGQAMTVTRSVNGISKPHAAGAGVALAHPVVIPL
ncbi:hypothetical protein QCN29_26740 [Streptomyces sp. HNM0663]|uniref:Tip attachment protein J domain-containing protein n=1 Tax=Streptomyces chengmaiensis TaxID=3040919 RepID=A0ABT6HUB5_9ACTN|nr:hypothetical protein [Streptomyces chengmaiensis]MDH2392309.1 hypothetical protein [Streptomyces chengmaiensis]